MKYYIPELWDKVNSIDENERNEAELEWEKNREIYLKIFDEISKKLPKKFIKEFLKNDEFHDYYLENIEIADKGGSHLKKRHKFPIEVKLTINYESENHPDDRWKIIYKRVKNISIIQPNEESLDKWDGFGSLDFNEFSMIDSKTFSHEILLVSGYSIIIYFEDISAEKIN